MPYTPRAWKEREVREVRAVVFDAYGTLFDVHSVLAACEAAFPGRGEALSRAWRAKQLEYTWLTALMGRYRDFWQITEAALVFACRSLGLPGDEVSRARLMDAYLRLDPYPEVPQALATLAGWPLAILSNGSPPMLAALVENTGLTARFAQVISVDEVRTYKPSPRVYELAPRRLGLAKEHIAFVSANSFDAVGAKSFGFTVLWVNRAGAPLDELGFAPDATVKDLSGVADLLRPR